jgi:hypothetical protein
MLSWFAKGMAPHAGHNWESCRSRLRIARSSATWRLTQRSASCSTALPVNSRYWLARSARSRAGRPDEEAARSLQAEKASQGEACRLRKRCAGPGDSVAQRTRTRSAVARSEPSRNCLPSGRVDELDRITGSEAIAPVRVNGLNMRFCAPTADGSARLILIGLGWVRKPVAAAPLHLRPVHPGRCGAVRVSPM